MQNVTENIGSGKGFLSSVPKRRVSRGQCQLACMTDVPKRRRNLGALIRNRRTIFYVYGLFE